MFENKPKMDIFACTVSMSFEDENSADVEFSYFYIVLYIKIEEHRMALYSSCSHRSEKNY